MVLMRVLPYPIAPIPPEFRPRIGEIGIALNEFLTEGNRLAFGLHVILDERRLLWEYPGQAKPEVPAMPDRFVSYLRVSTRKQGESGLGVEAQREAVHSFVSRTGGKAVKEFVEVESGGKTDRPQLAAALAFAKRSKATLLVAKLDRLSRNVAFLATLLESGVDFVAADNPYANKLTLHNMAAMAEYEREMIAERTKVALKAAKARGVKLGSAREGHWEGREETRVQGGRKGGARAGETHRRNADAAYADILPAIRALRDEGLSLYAIAQRLNADGVPTRRGKTWTAETVKRVLARNAL